MFERTQPQRANLLDRKRNTAATLARLLQELAGRSAKDDTGPGVAVDSVTAERLKTLGYVSGRVEIGAMAGADPKTQIARYVGYVEQFTHGVDALQAGQQRESERVFQRLVRQFPASYEVHQYLGPRARGARRP